MAEHAGKLEGKIAVVTGAGRGIGRAIALAYAREGAVVCCAARTRPDVQSTVEEIDRLGGWGLAARTDVTDLESVRRMFRLALRPWWPRHPGDQRRRVLRPPGC